MDLRATSIGDTDTTKEAAHSSNRNKSLHIGTECCRYL